MILLNALRVIGVTGIIPDVGAWVADMTIDLDPGQSLPSGRAVLTIGSRACVCTVDADASGTFGERHSVRVVGGANGWSKTVPAQDYDNPGGVPLSAIVATTAVACGETPAILADRVVGTHYVRRDDRASHVLDGALWWVGLDGVTYVGSARPEVPAAPEVEVLDWDPNTSVAHVSCADPIEPGAVLSDSRFGRLVVRDVEFTADGEGFRAVVTCGPAQGARLLSALAQVAREAVGAEWCRAYRYRVVGDIGDKVTLQSVRSTVGMPDLLPISIWHGVPGVNAVLMPGSEVLVEFLEGDPAQPVVVAFEPSEGAGFKPILLKLNAQTLVQVGDTPFPLAKASETLAAISTLLIALQTLQSSISGFTPQGNNVKWSDLTPMFNAAVNAATAAIAIVLPTLPTTKLVAQ